MQNLKFYFQYNLPADNHRNGKTDYYIGVKSEKMDGYTHVFTEPLVEKSDLRVVLNWNKVLDDIDKIGEEHFAEINKQEEIEKAKQLLGLNDVNDLGTIKINELGKAEPV